MKLQPVFSWQKYEGEPEDQQEQFQYQLQQQYILVSNAVNATIDDESFFLKERVTSFTWVPPNSSKPPQPIRTVTVPVVWASGGLTSTNPLPIAGSPNTGDFTVIRMECCLSNGTTRASTTLPVPYVDTTALSNQISIARVGANVVLTAGINRSAYTGYVTVYFINS